MFSVGRPPTEPVATLDPLDRAAIAYVCLPLLIFVAAWLRWWAAVPLLLCMAGALWPAFRRPDAAGNPHPVSGLQLAVAITVGCGWAALGGTDHLVFANPDWHIRDAVLHDLVVSSWPVGYGVHDGQETVLRTSIAYYLPAAVIGKVAGLAAAHAAMAVWTAAGATLFLTQVLSLSPSRLGGLLLVAAVVVLFSGMDIIGALLNSGPRFRQDWNITTHIEWWAGIYQYSSMTTQLFWVPNHAIAAWLVIGLMCRNGAPSVLHGMLPVLLVAAALWSPLSAIGILPFAAWRSWLVIRQAGLAAMLHPAAWLMTLLVGLVIAGYLVLDPGGVAKGMPIAGVSDPTLTLLRQLQFFLLEAGILGLALLLVKPSIEVALALAFLLLLPSFSLGPGNDLVMRASIPSLAVLAIAACGALRATPIDRRAARAKKAVGAMLLIGAATPIAELARAVMLPAWPINTHATLVGADCGHFPPHYIARVGNGMLARIMREPNALPLSPQGPEQCDNPGRDLMWALPSPPRRT